MLQFISHKIRNKKILNSSLLVGVILLAGFLCIYPMFREGSLNRLIQTMFVEYAQEYREFPAALMKSGTLAVEKANSLEQISDAMGKVENKWIEQMDCPVVQTEHIFHMKAGNAETTFSDKTRIFSLGYVPDLYQYADVVYGVKAEDAENSDNEFVQKAVKDGAYPCVISQTVMDKYGLVVGETLSINFRTYSDKEGLELVVSGIIEEKEQDNYFWYKRLSEYNDMAIIPGEVYDTVLKRDDVTSSDYDLAVLFDYTTINYSNADHYKGVVNRLLELDEKLNSNFQETLVSYSLQEKSIGIILFTFELPIVALLLLFLYMISSRILEMETTEIAMLKSRGVSRIKIIGLYIAQSSVISFFGSVVGLPVGYLMCKLAAGTNAFLSFSMKDVSIYQPTISMLLFALLAFVLAVLFMTLPVIGLSKLTITDRKNLRIADKSIPFWQKYFLDLILLAVSGYLLYNYIKQSSVISVEIIAGKSIDPIIFLNSFLFILSCGLVFLRIMGYLVRVINHFGKKRWSPSVYIAFLQIIRSAKKQGFITVFLVMTISMGIFNANLARTVNENLEQRTAYNMGADLRIQEKWKLTTIRLNTGEILWNYREPDFSRYKFLNEYGITKFAKVILDRNVDISINKKVEKGNMLMAIHTKEFGEAAKLDGNLNDQHWFHYLNELAKDPKGVIISSNLAHKYELKVGDKVSYARYSPIDKSAPYTDTAAKVVGIVDAFPGFESVVYVQTADGSLVEKENYLIVANYATVVNNCSQTPYEIWANVDNSIDVNEIREAIEEKGIVLSDITEHTDEIKKQRNSAMIQITNGMFSIGFIISLLICAVGFLIYWVLTIKEREMLYGIYRAMGMTMKEITRMLVVEQLFSSLLAALSGYGVGIITTIAFTKLISIVYLPRKHNLPIEIFFKAEDIVKMTVMVAVTFTICFIVMSHTVRKMNITKALKMGED